MIFNFYDLKFFYDEKSQIIVYVKQYTLCHWRGGGAFVLPPGQIRATCLVGCGTVVPIANSSCLYGQKRVLRIHQVCGRLLMELALFKRAANDKMLAIGSISSEIGF